MKQKMWFQTEQERSIGDKVVLVVYINIDKAWCILILMRRVVRLLVRRGVRLLVRRGVRLLVRRGVRLLVGRININTQDQGQTANMATISIRLL